MLIEFIYNIKMKIISWNVNGLRSAITKENFMPFLEAEKPDILCLQETKLSSPEYRLELEGYHQYFLNAKRKGYSGTAIITKVEPLSVKFGIGVEEHDNEGRVVTAEYDSFYLVCVYVPNSQRELARLAYRQHWDADFSHFLSRLASDKDVIVCGDLNVAHQEIDIKNPKTNMFNPGFSKEERDDFSQLLDSGFVDTFRHFHPEEVKYSWWSYMFQARAKNVGWRIDYFISTPNLLQHISKADILTEVLGSDHAPIVLELNC